MYETKLWKTRHFFFFASICQRDSKIILLKSFFLKEDENTKVKSLEIHYLPLKKHSGFILPTLIVYESENASSDKLAQKMTHFLRILVNLNPPGFLIQLSIFFIVDLSDLYFTWA